MTTDGGNPVRPISGYGWSSKEIGEEIREEKMIDKHWIWDYEGEEIRRDPNPGSSPSAKHGVGVASQ